MQLVTINGKYEIWLPDHRAARPEWYTESGWEKKRLQYLKSSIFSGSIVYYAGAEEGDMPGLCQMWGAKVFLIEPNPKVWPNIKAIWEANNLEKPMGYFVGFASSETNLNPVDLDFLTGDNDGWPICAYGELISNHGFRELNHQKSTTPQIKIDDIKTLPPDIISIDVEGSEWEVLKGAEKTILNHKPTLFVSIHPEFMALQYGQYSRDLRNWIKDRGYKETLIEFEHEAHFIYE